jgi:hypothetical protein
MGTTTPSPADAADDDNNVASVNAIANVDPVYARDDGQRQQ